MVPLCFHPKSSSWLLDHHWRWGTGFPFDTIKSKALGPSFKGRNMIFLWFNPKSRPRLLDHSWRCKNGSPVINEKIKRSALGALLKVRKIVSLWLKKNQEQRPWCIVDSEKDYYPVNWIRVPTPCRTLHNNARHWRQGPWTIVQGEKQCPPVEKRPGDNRRWRYSWPSLYGKR